MSGNKFFISLPLLLRPARTRGQSESFPRRIGGDCDAVCDASPLNILWYINYHDAFAMCKEFDYDCSVQRLRISVMITFVTVVYMLRRAWHVLNFRVFKKITIVSIKEQFRLILSRRSIVNNCGRIKFPRNFRAWRLNLWTIVIKLL